MNGTNGSDARAAERELVIVYARRGSRSALAALLALDRRLGDLVAGSREPMVVQMRLTWWHEALTRLDTAPPPAEPVLAALAVEVLPRGIRGEALATMIDGWERLLDEPLDDAGLIGFAEARGATLFSLVADLLGERGMRLADVGEGWALADLACRIGEPDVARRAAAMAAERLDKALAWRWPRALRPLGALALLARADLAGIAPGSPRRIARLLGHRLTGR